MLSSGDVVSLRSRLTGHVETDRLNNFLDSIYKLREDAPKGDGAKAYVNIVFIKLSTLSKKENLLLLLVLIERAVRFDFCIEINN